MFFILSFSCRPGNSLFWLENILASLAERWLLFTCPLVICCLSGLLPCLQKVLNNLGHPQTHLLLCDEYVCVGTCAQGCFLSILLRHWHFPLPLELLQYVTLSVHLSSLHWKQVFMCECVVECVCVCVWTCECEHAVTLCYTHYVWRWWSSLLPSSPSFQ